MEKGEAKKNEINLIFYGSQVVRCPPKLKRQMETEMYKVSKEDILKVGEHKAFIYTDASGRQQTAFCSFGLNYSPVLHDLLRLVSISQAEAVQMSRSECIRTLEQKIEFPFNTK
jgi:hypothetical protein